MRLHNIEVKTLLSEPIPQSQSGVIIASWMGILFMALGLVGVAVKPETQSAWTDLAIQAAPLVGGLVAFVVAWVRRRSAKAPIEGGSADPKVLAQEQIRSELR